MFYRTKLSPFGHKAGCYWESGGSYKQSGNFSVGVPVSATLRSTRPGWPLVAVRVWHVESHVRSRWWPRYIDDPGLQEHKTPPAVDTYLSKQAGRAGLGEQSWVLDSTAGQTVSCGWYERIVRGALRRLWEAVSETGFLTFEGASFYPGHLPDVESGPSKKKTVFQAESWCFKF